MDMVKVILVVAIMHDLRLDQLDIKNVFLNDDLEEEVYMCLLPTMKNQESVVN